MFYETKYEDGFYWFRTTPNEKYQMHSLKWHLEHAAEIIDNVRLGLYDDETTNIRLEHAQDLIMQVAKWFSDNKMNKG